MSYPRIFERVYLNPVCVTNARFASIHAFLLPRIRGDVPVTVAAEEASPSRPRPTRSRYSGRRAQRAAPLIDLMTGEMIDERFYTVPKPGIAVVPVYGALAKNLSAWEEECGGGTDINAIEYAIRQAQADESIEHILLDFDSPGGEVTNIPELASLIAGSAKPIYAFTDASMCSAAYWLASGAKAIWATRSACVGSIGVYLAWLDESVRLQLEGVRLQFFAAGKHKGIGLPGRALSEEDRALLQSSVDRIYADFTAAVRAGRGEGISGDVMQGQTFDGAGAKAAGLVSEIVESFEDLIASFPEKKSKPAV